MCVRVCVRFNCPAVLSGLLSNQDFFCTCVLACSKLSALSALLLSMTSQNTHTHGAFKWLSGFFSQDLCKLAGEGGKEKKAAPHRDGLTFLSFTPHSLDRSLTSAHQVGDSDDGERDAVVPQSHRRPRYSPASDLFRGIPLPRRYHGDMNPQVHSSDGAFSVSVSAGCARTYVCRLCGRARTVASVCVILLLFLFFFQTGALKRRGGSGRSQSDSSSVTHTTTSSLPPLDDCEPRPGRFILVTFHC